MNQSTTSKWNYTHKGDYGTGFRHDLLQVCGAMWKWMGLCVSVAWYRTKLPFPSSMSLLRKYAIFQTECQPNTFHLQCLFAGLGLYVPISVVENAFPTPEILPHSFVVDFVAQIHPMCRKVFLMQYQSLSTWRQGFLSPHSQGSWIMLEDHWVGLKQIMQII